MTILVFPSSLEASVAFVEDVKSNGETIIGASSLDNDPYKRYYNAWEKLPFIHEKNYADALRSIVKRYNISSIFTPHAPTYHYLTKLLPTFPGVNLLGESPCSSQMQRVTAALIKGKAGLDTISSITGKSLPIHANFLASLLAESVSIYGECSHEKMIGLCSAFADTTKGDVIEVGTFFGKSVYILNRLAAYFHIGATLAVDPWNAELSVQHESPQTIQQLSDVWDWELVFQGFLLTMQARYAEPFNYMRTPSAEAFIQYREKNYVSTPEFGKTPLAGTIAILHLDGNHDEKAVAEDFHLWSQCIAPGGWIIFDDYEWSQGSGPRKVVEKITINWNKRIVNFFVAGGAAFIKISEKNNGMD